MPASIGGTTSTMTWTPPVVQLQARNAIALGPGVRRLIENSTSTNDVVKQSFVVGRRQYNVNGVHTYAKRPVYFYPVGECCLETAHFPPNSKP